MSLLMMLFTKPYNLKRFIVVCVMSLGFLIPTDSTWEFFYSTLLHINMKIGSRIRFFSSKTFEWMRFSPLALVSGFTRCAIMMADRALIATWAFSDRHTISLRGNFGGFK